MPKKTEINITNASLIIDKFVNKPDNKKISDWEDIYAQLLCIAGRNKKCKAGSLSSELRPSDKKKIIDFAGKGCSQFINAISSLPCVLKPITKMLSNFIVWRIAWLFGFAPEKYSIDDKYVEKRQIDRVFYCDESSEEAEIRQLMIWQARTIALIFLHYGVNDHSKEIIKKLIKCIKPNINSKVKKILDVPVVIKSCKENPFSIKQYLDDINIKAEYYLNIFLD
jgi:hypothetical protein